MSDLEENLLLDGDRAGKRAEYDTESKDNSLLQYKEMRYSRTLLLLLIQVMYFHIGAAYYSFPMWLNQIMTSHVDLSRSELSLFGGTTYVSLGLCGSIVLWFSTLGYSKWNGFRILTSFALFSLSLAWSLLVWLVWTSVDVSECAPLVGMSTVLIGFGAGVFYLLWFGQVLTIVKPQWHFLYINMTSMMFPIGATFYLSLKLVMTSKDWTMLILVAHVSVITGMVVWVFYRPELIFARLEPHNEKILSVEQPLLMNHAESKSLKKESDTEAIVCEMRAMPDSKKFLKDLFMWKRPYSREELAADVNDVSSRQFYLILGSYVMVLSVCTAFMANIGPLTSDSDTTEDSSRAELLVMIYVAAGQTFGRFLVPVITHAVDKYLEQTIHSDTHNIAQTEARVAASMRVKNNFSLALTQTIGIVITAALLCLLIIDQFSFTLMSTIISVAYGMTWNVVSGYPSFFYQFDFTLFLSTFQIFGAAGTLTLVLLISMMEFGNGATFAVLLVGSITIVVVSSAALVDRWSTAPRVSTSI